MHSLGDSFGFRRSNEHLFSGPENARIPFGFTGLQGDLVQIDPASADGVLSSSLLKSAAANAVLVPGYCGLLVQYEEFVTSDGINQQPILNTRDLSRVRPGLMALIVTGAGLKVWVKNLAAVTASATAPQYKAYSAETRVTLTSMVVGDMVRWTGSVYARTTDATQSIGTVTRVTSSGAEFTLNA